MVTLTACLVRRAQPCGLRPGLLVMLQLLPLGGQGHCAGTLHRRRQSAGRVRRRGSERVFGLPVKVP